MADVKFTVMIQGSNEQFFEFALPKDTDIATLKLVIESQCNIQSDQQQLYYKNKFISSDTQTLQSLNLAEDDVIVIKNVSSNRIDLGFPAFSPMHDIPQMPKWLTMDSKELQQSIRNDKVLMQQLLHQNPVFAQSVLSDDLTLLNGILNQKRMEFNQKAQMEQRRRALLNADPLNPEHQKLILGEMEQENINQNYTTAMDQMPEAFGRVVMLYVPMEIEGVCVNAFIDSGAQSTIMSREYAEKTNLMRLVDKRFSGIAKGVGTAKIIGRVHIAKIKFGNIFLSSSFTIIDQQGMDFLFGLDMLRRHQAQIDLHKNVLRIGSEEVPFLQEKDIPHLKQYDNEHHHEAMDEDSALQNALLQSVNEQKGNEADADNNNNNNSNNSNNSNNNNNDSITTLINLGYSQSQSQNALTICGGNVEMAASYLFSTFGGGLGF